ncbi:hypothetical protein NIF40_11505, partial [[Clostridium] leptum]|nr:hypothetical protein [[Clostridium] leptum]
MALSVWELGALSLIIKAWYVVVKQNTNHGNLLLSLLSIPFIFLYRHISYLSITNIEKGGAYLVRWASLINNWV